MKYQKIYLYMRLKIYKIGLSGVLRISCQPDKIKSGTDNERRNRI